ncbi:hypothetical protein BH10BAC5_BH10BAC5_20610 [soil metagenome]
MPVIKLKTKINAPMERCFLLSLSVDLHQLSTEQTNEKAIAGITSGIMKLNDTVTWRAKHFGIYLTLTSKITEYEYPDYFVDEMVEGAFKNLHHTHSFNWCGDHTELIDVFNFEAPAGIIGKIFSNLILKKYLTRFLSKRNQMIKFVAEGEEWKELLNR